jgi:hypothetical protein
MHFAKQMKEMWDKQYTRRRSRPAVITNSAEHKKLEAL